MFFDTPRYVRCYDDQSSKDRYTVVFARDKEHTYIAMSADPLHPDGKYCSNNHTNAIDDPSHVHLGKKILFADLPLDCQWVVIRDYCDRWNLDLITHPLTQVVNVGFSVFFRNPNKAWRPNRPLDGYSDNRSVKQYQSEKQRLQVDNLHPIVRLAREGVTEEQVEQWSWADRRDVYEWSILSHIAASDNAVRVPEIPEVLRSVS